MENETTEMKKLFKTNPYEGYRLKAEQRMIDSKFGKLNPVHEVVNVYYKMNGMDGKPKKFYEGRYSYGRLAGQAKRLLVSCNQELDDALWCLDKMKYIAEKKGFDWTIGTCLKHELRWGK